MNAPGNYPNHGSHLREVGRFLRRFRNAVLSFELRPGARWHHEPIANPNSHICHNDIAPKVTVFRDGEPVAFLDWDFAHLGQAMWVVAHAAWQFGGLTGDGSCPRHGWRSLPDRFRRLRTLCDSYGAKVEDRLGFAQVAVQRMEATATGIEALAAAGKPEYARLSVAGIPAMIQPS